MNKPTILLGAMTVLLPRRGHMRRGFGLHTIGGVMVGLLLVGTLAYGANSPRKTAPDVIWLRPDAHAPQSAHAGVRQTAGLQEGAIVVMIGGTLAQFNALLGLALGEAQPHALTSPSAPPEAIPSQLEVIAAHITPRRALHSFQCHSTGTTDEDDAADEDETPRLGPECQRALAAWIAQEHTPAAPQEGPTSAWIELQSLSAHMTDPCGNQVSTSALFSRLADINADGDWYLVTNTPQTIPNNASSFETSKRMPQISLISFPPMPPFPPAETELTEHQPTGTITTESTSFTIGETLSAGTNFSFGLSASVSFSWQQPAVTTTDQTSDTDALWEEHFESGTPTAQGTFFSNQAAIFKVPEGTQTLPMFAWNSAQWSHQCGGNTGYGVVIPVILYPPVFSVSADTVQIARGGQGEVTVTAEIPNSPQGLAWTLSVPDQPPWLTFSQASGTTSATIQLDVAPDAPIGSTAFLNFQTEPPFGAPSVEQAPLIVQVEVVAP